ncbi:tetratricopeptide repeat protein [Bartonella ancashensis]|uniref:Tetratricopeptide repeat family protein n=1 Tax=Bartonella ancashensis TaxID=1318743 RepID=A0A0M4L696_9HYPH|nr:tetratricopeptide repeat protein [Bartonella ancashensis]ALE03120.1 tetratricopeptide repeat family protein [Bartonella ancashensis]
MMKYLVRRIILAIFSFFMTNAAHAEKSEIEKLQSPLKMLQDSTIGEGKSASQPIKPGEYDEAYDYYYQGYYSTALRLALKRAENGDPYAQTLVGKICMEGYALPFDGGCTALWLGRAAEQGDAHAQLRYGLMMFNGTFVPKNQEKGEELIHQAVQAGLREAYFYAGQLLLKKSAPPQSALQVADVSKRDDETNTNEALVLFLKGAALGDSEAALAAAEILVVGTKKYPKNEGYARQLISIAAQHKNATAQIILAQWLIQGRGGEVDLKKAFSLLFQNAHNGAIPAQINLARLYLNGMGVEKDVVMAAAWYMVAQRSDAQAPDLDKILKNMTEAQLKESQNKAIQLTSWL